MSQNPVPARRAVEILDAARALGDGKPLVFPMRSGRAIWTFRSIGRNITDTVVTRREHTLVTSGPYRYVRHPFYVTTALACVANALTTANWFIALTGFAALALLVIRTATEEAKLVERFGDDYEHYMARTGRFFPRLSSAPPTVE